MRRMPRLRDSLFAVGLALAFTCLAAAAGIPAEGQSVAGTGGQTVVQGTAAVPAAGKTGSPAGLDGLPASFEGDLPAADGPGIRYHLDLFPDQAFALRLTYLGRKDDTRFDDIGNWMVSADGGTLTLRGGREAPVMFAIQDARTLRKLDLAGRAIESKLNYDLTRREPFEPIEPRLLLRGMYRYMADAGMFQECLTGWRLPVAQEADNAKLETAYSRARREPGEELLVTLEGSIASRPRMEGPGMQRALVPERFINVWPGETCGPRHSEATLENTVPVRTETLQAPPKAAAAVS